MRLVLTTALATLLPLAGAWALVGDCDSDGRVSIAELQRCSRIFMGKTPLSACPACDVDGDGRVKIWELQRASLIYQGEQRQPTPTFSPTATPSSISVWTPLPTITPAPGEPPRTQVDVVVYAFIPRNSVRGQTVARYDGRKLTDGAEGMMVTRAEADIAMMTKQVINDELNTAIDGYQFNVVAQYVLYEDTPITVYMDHNGVPHMKTDFMAIFGESEPTPDYANFAAPVRFCDKHSDRVRLVVMWWPPIKGEADPANNIWQPEWVARNALANYWEAPDCGGTAHYIALGCNWRRHGASCVHSASHAFAEQFTNLCRACWDEHTGGTEKMYGNNGCWPKPYKCGDEHAPPGSCNYRYEGPATSVQITCEGVDEVVSCRDWSCTRQHGYPLSSILDSQFLYFRWWFKRIPPIWWEYLWIGNK